MRLPQLLGLLPLLATPLLASMADTLAWKEQHGKKYAAEEEGFRMKIWMDNKQKIEKHNKLFYKGEVTYNKGTNQFSALLESEWLALVPGCRINVTSSSGH